MAHRNALVPPVREWTLGDPHEFADEKTARVLLCASHGQLVALHGFIKKTRSTPSEDMALARSRQKELEG
jgi:phage-related protein